ncbi:MAG TPA: Rieske (2Fe-2S) protein [Ignavibacteria bacterium]|mgnify:CR=1 FL=1|nr:Rieske (2Fe-2S) protein [Ignavibacteria bacterium]
MEKENFNRRDFLKSSLKTIALGSIALSALDVKKLFAEADADSSSTAAKVINISDYPELGSVGGNTSIGNLFISRTGDSKFLALSLLCTHKKCSVDYTGSGFECPCHGSTFSSTGKVTNGPATKNLRSYKSTYNSENNTLTVNM